MEILTTERKMQIADNLRSVCTILMDHLIKMNKDGRGKQDAEDMRNDFAVALHCIDLCEHYRWIPVSERLPEEFVPVLVCSEHNTVYIADWNGETWEFENGAVDFENCEFRHTHWMPLHEPPEESK